MGNTALYIGADPCTFNDVALVRKAVRTFGFVRIFLDRKNRDAEYKQYLLSYQDRSDVLRHDLKAAGVDGYEISPIDETFEKAMKDNGVGTLVLNFDYQQNTRFRMFKILQYVNPDLDILLMRAENYIEPKFIKTLLDSDSSLSIYRKFCSEYAFTKLKIKTMKKVAVTGLIGTDYSAVKSALEDRGYTVFDVDDAVRNAKYGSPETEGLRKAFAAKGVFFEKFDRFSVMAACAKDEAANRVFQKFLCDDISRRLAARMQSMFNNRIAVVFSMLCELGMEGMFDRTVCAKCSPEDAAKNLVSRGYGLDSVQELAALQMGADEKAELCGISVDAAGRPGQIAKILGQKLGQARC